MIALGRPAEGHVYFPHAMNEAVELLKVLNDELTGCRKCPRLVEYRERVAREKRRAYRDWTYWGRPVPGFGDPHGRLFLLGLAPGAHGSNRTGRMFTGDRSGDFLYAALYRAGFANQAACQHAGDGLELTNVYVSAAGRCAPPGNKPLREELHNCRGYLERELEILKPKVVLALGKIAWDAYLDLLKAQRAIPPRGKPAFAHGAEVRLPDPLPLLVGVYHPSQQNTQTGRITAAMYAAVLERIQRRLASAPAAR
jgi:uracil-DNA glycosylase